ncbi:MAG: tRNA nucleotidyltransferase, partial [Abditibacteriota bacterium]|nr:tRNA nucleotidyltransferase [Abditibacteriota bacterium]
MEQLLREMRLALEGSGLEDKIYIVGGLVRDSLLNRDVSDPDFMTDCDPAEVCRLLVKKGFGSRPRYLPEFYSAKLYRGDVCIEMTGGRSETYTPGSRKPRVKPAPLEEDAFRRDFTVNALYRNLCSGEILDPTGMGLADLKAGLLRTPIDPATC